MRLWRLRRNWNQLGHRDPLESILTRTPDKTAAWDVDEFFRTGGLEVARVMAHVDRLAPSLSKARALDFGCGVGRVTQGLADHFTEAVGVDVAVSMVEAARKWNRQPDRCRFTLNEATDLRQFESNGFDLVYSRLVLQHIPPNLVKGYIPELVRVLKPDGLLMFQLPEPQRKPVQVDPIEAFCNSPVVGGRFKQSMPGWVVRTYRRLKYPFLPTVISRAWGHLYRQVRDYVVPHMDMFGLRRETVVNVIEDSGGQVAEIQSDSSVGSDIQSYEYWVTKASPIRESENAVDTREGAPA